MLQQGSQAGLELSYEVTETITKERAGTSDFRTLSSGQTLILSIGDDEEAAILLFSWGLQNPFSHFLFLCLFLLFCFRPTLPSDLHSGPPASPSSHSPTWPSQVPISHQQVPSSHWSPQGWQTAEVP